MGTPRWIRAGRTLAVVVAVATGAAACSSTDPQPAATGPSGGFVGVSDAAPTALQEGRSCDDVLDDFQSFAPAVLNDTGAAREGFTTSAQAEESDAAAGSTSFAPGVASDDAAGPGADGPTSDTNTQEEGIDEPDVVETDGDHVYVVDGDRLVVLDGASATVVGETALAGHGAQLLLSGDRLMAIVSGGYGIAGAPVGRGAAVEDFAVDDSAVGEVGEVGSGQVGSGEPPGPGSAPAAPGAVPVEPPSFPTGTVIQLLDVSDPAAPKPLETTELEGQHVSTRVVDGVARVVLSSFPQAAFDLPTVPDGGGTGTAVADGIGATRIEDWLPSFRTTAGTGSEPVEGELVDCEDVLVPEVNAGIAETSVLSIDFREGFDPGDTTTIVAEAGAVYASASTLYVAANRYVAAGDRADVAAEDWSTAIHAFDLRGEGPAVHAGAGQVPGNTLGQYSMSEHDGHLRIATTEGTPWGPGADSESAVRVLRLVGGELVEVGVVGGLGRTETIQSVRFMGPVGYVVTFRQVDPLYVIDLSDPRSPRAVGELKIPGFSSYLHPVGDGRLVGVGRDADLDGTDRGLLVSLFDVSDPTDPRQIQTYVEADAHSAAGQDPKAFLWWAPESALVIPVERYGPAVPHPQGIEIGMTVLDVDDAGITRRVTVTADGRYASRALVVQGRLWSIFDGAVVTSGFDGAGRELHPFR